MGKEQEFTHYSRLLAGCINGIEGVLLTIDHKSDLKNQNCFRRLCKTPDKNCVAKFAYNFEAFQFYKFAVSGKDGNMQGRTIEVAGAFIFETKGECVQHIAYHKLT